MRRELPPINAATATPVAAQSVAAQSVAAKEAKEEYIAAAAAAPQGPGPSPQVCRPYSAPKTAMGLNQPVRGLACRRADGRWQLVSEIPDD